MSLTEYGVWAQDINLMLQGAKGFLQAYDDYQKDPIASGNRFTYANTPESVCYCLFHLSMGMFQQGCYSLDKLGVMLEKTKSDFNKGMRADIAKVFSMFGITKEGLRLKPKKEINPSAWEDK